MTGLPARLLSGTVISAVGRVVGTAVSVGTIAIVTRSLVATSSADGGLAAYGVYATVLAYLAVVAVFADGGLYVVFTREASRAGVNEALLLEAAWLLRLVTIALALIGAALLTLLLPYSAEIRHGIFLGMWGAGFQLASQLFLGVFQKRLQLATPALGEVVGRVAQFVIVALVAWQRGGITGFLVAFVAGTAVTCAWNIVGARRLLRFRLLPFPRLPLVTALLRQSWPVGVSLILSLIFFKVDAVLLSLLRGPADVALYALPYKVLESLLFFPAMVGGMLLPVFSRVSTRDPRGVEAPLKTAVDAYLLGAIPLVLTLFWASPWVLAVLGGGEFSASVPVLRILAVTLGALFFGNLYGNALIALGDQRRLLKIYAFLVFVNVAVNLALIPRYSYFGAAWTTLGTEALSVAIAAALLLRRRLRIAGTAATPRILLAGGACVALTLLPLHLIPRLALGLGAYALVLLWFGVVTPGKILRLIRSQGTYVSS